jgi:UDP-N-acetylmuramyl pentapeptide synthase
MDWSGTTFAARAADSDWNGEYTVVLPGRHSVTSALNALAVASTLGLSPTAVRRGLATFQPPAQRLSVRAAGGVQLLDDTYNANPDSMRAALQTLSDLPCAGRRVAALGEMAELGPHAETAHAEVGRFSEELGIDAVFAVGRYAALTAGGSGQGLCQAFSRMGDASAAVLQYIRSGDTILIKGSRSSRMERMVEVLLKQLDLREHAGTLEMV